MTRGPRSRNGYAAQSVLQVLADLGTDGDGRNVSIRTEDLCTRAGVTANNLARIVGPLVEAGQVLACKITRPEGRGGPMKEYRLASMVVPPFVPLNARRAGIAHGAPTKPLPVTTSAPHLSTPARGVNEIEPPRFGHQPRPAVGKNTGSVRSVSPSPDSTEARAVAPGEVTPKPESERRGIGPARVKASAGDARRLRLSMDHYGGLQIGDEDDPAEMVFTPDETLAIGDFMHATEGLWRP